MHDIVTGDKNGEEARDYYAKEFLDARRKKPTPHMDELHFKPARRQRDRRAPSAVAGTSRRFLSLYPLPFCSLSLSCLAKARSASSRLSPPKRTPCEVATRKFFTP